MTNEMRQARDFGPMAIVDPVGDVREAASVAYCTLVRHVGDLALVVLHPPEAAMLRAAADACVFDDHDAVERVAAACELLARLSEYGRLEPQVAARLGDELVAVDCESRRLATVRHDTSEVSAAVR